MKWILLSRPSEMELETQRSKEHISLESAEKDIFSQRLSTDLLGDVQDSSQQ